MIDRSVPVRTGPAGTDRSLTSLSARRACSSGTADPQANLFWTPDGWCADLREYRTYSVYGEGDWTLRTDNTGLGAVVDRSLSSLSNWCKRCAVCGEQIAPTESSTQPYPPNGDWVHASDEDGCSARYWDPPGEKFLTEESW